MITIDNALSDLEFQNLKDIICSSAFPWFYGSTAYQEHASTVHDYSWFHMALNEHGKNSSVCDILEESLLNALKKANCPIKKILRIRIGLITVTPTSIVHAPHVDLLQPHKTGLLYINDSDGDTLIYNEEYDPATGLGVFDFYKTVLNETVSIKHISKPVANKIVCFEGYQYHSSSSPTLEPRRIVITFNYE